MKRLLLALACLAIVPSVAPAQEPQEKGFFDEAKDFQGPASGDPLYGYVGTGLLCSGILFIIAKSARR